MESQGRMAQMETLVWQAPKDRWLALLLLSLLSLPSQSTALLQGGLGMRGEKGDPGPKGVVGSIVSMQGWDIIDSIV